MVTLRVKRLTNTFEKARGLLGSSKAHPVYCTTRFGIHTFFMRFPIDVVILDDRFTVVKFVEGLQPNRIFVWHPRYRHVIELPKGEIQKNHIKLGATITLQYL